MIYFQDDTKATLYVVVSQNAELDDTLKETLDPMTLLFRHQLFS